MEKGISRKRVAEVPLYSPARPSWRIIWTVVTARPLEAALCMLIIIISIGFVATTWLKPAPAPASMEFGIEMEPSLRARRAVR